MQIQCRSGRHIKPRLDEQIPTRAQPVTCELRLSAGSCVYTNALIRCLLAFSLINRVAVDAPTSTILHKEASSSPGALESSSKSCRSDQPTLGLGWHGAEHGYPNRAGPARFHLGTEPSTTRVNIPSRADWCLSLHRQRACGRQRAIRYLKVRSF